MIFCKHNWKVLTDKLIPSFFERSGTKKFSGTIVDETSSTHIVICSCDKCGKIKQFVNKV